jgi:hypothetical protein
VVGNINVYVYQLTQGFIILLFGMYGMWKYLSTDPTISMFFLFFGIYVAAIYWIIITAAQRVLSARGVKALDWLFLVI